MNMNISEYEIKSSKSYQLAERITRLMDKYYLDAVLGFCLKDLATCSHSCLRCLTFMSVQLRYGRCL